ncbi:hypothetical protein ThrDRAFT_02587, partial [Frankia casuarinae]|uniref:Uncharacterized protein n=2 Tax=Frankia TaxID=1854 RepID=Q2J9K3_FRACC|nr:MULTISPECIES: hypothetical protein [Frankia]KDA40415.1 hypothetical protein BMG523Draft_04780 [Frankia sp. BMG5.23]OFB39373.1 hypothetical protein Manayef4_04365 [Frankia sp. CgIM4]ORT53300.1 hypothetical protein KBI5_07345 [Frankia sp. KB5]ABD12039.1 hypothetical protein Francci3_2677 [Frankia casuarinae]ESZ99740.1 hypothetical protein CcI6DRAFT_04848 [Frankia sp. CcI6]
MRTGQGALGGNSAVIRADPEPAAWGRAAAGTRATPTTKTAEPSYKCVCNQGVVQIVHRWRAEVTPDGPTDAQVSWYGGVARMP